MQIIIDRFETKYAIVELPDGNKIDIPRELFPDAVEGDVYVISKDADEKEKREIRIQKKLDNLMAE